MRLFRPVYRERNNEMHRFLKVGTLSLKCKHIDFVNNLLSLSEEGKFVDFSF